MSVGCCCVTHMVYHASYVQTIDFCRLLSSDGGFAFSEGTCDSVEESDADGYGEELTFLVKRFRVDDSATAEDTHTMSYIS